MDVGRALHCIAAFIVAYQSGCRLLWMAEIHVCDILWLYKAHKYMMRKASRKKCLFLLDLEYDLVYRTAL